MAVLYTPEILRTALNLVDYPRLDAPGVTVNRRATPCGSQIIVDLNIDAQGAVKHIGMRVTACAFGQAAAAIMAQTAIGKNHTQLQAAHDAIARWLRDADASIPDWPGIAKLAPARAYPARHGAILLPFAAMCDALAMPASPEQHTA